MSDPLLQRIRDRALAVPGAYGLFKKLIGAGKDRSVFAREHVRAKDGDRVLDIGCGTADVLSFLPRVEYTGFDPSAEYIATATARYGDRAKFYCQRVSEQSLVVHHDFDIVLAQGVLHHLDDAEARRLFRLAHAALKPGGRLVTLDGVYVPGQSRVARLLLSRDRGKFVRHEQGYRELAEGVFDDVGSAVRHDLLNIPYTLLVLDCTK